MRLEGVKAVETPQRQHTSMSMNLGIHAVALLNICDYCTRIGSDKPEFVGALFGQVQEHEIIVNHTFELVMKDRKLDMSFLHERTEQFEIIYSGQRLIGWFAVGTSELEPWMAQVDEQVCQAVDAPIIGLFNVPFKAEMGILPFKFYNHNQEELKVQMRVDETEQIALQDVLSAQGRRNTVFAQLSKETRAFLLLHQHLAQLQALLKKGVEPKQQARIVSTIRQLCRTHDFGSAEQIQDIEKEVLAILSTGLVAKGNSIIARLPSKSMSI